MSRQAWVNHRHHGLGMIDNVTGFYGVKGASADQKMVIESALADEK